MRVPTALLAAVLALPGTPVKAATVGMPHNRPCDIAQDNPGNLNPDGGNAITFGLCGGIEDVPTGQEDVSRSQSWNAYNCGYQAYRQGKVFGANPYYNDQLEVRWSAGWKDARKACTTGRPGVNGIDSIVSVTGIKTHAADKTSTKQLPSRVDDTALPFLVQDGINQSKSGCSKLGPAIMEPGFLAEKDINGDGVKDYRAPRIIGCRFVLCESRS